MPSHDDLPALLSLSGLPFDDAQLDECEQRLGSLSNPDRISYRNHNASAIAASDAPHLLIVAGPGTGKSFLFMDRIRHWLREHPRERIYVSTFVRKLAQDLDNDVQTSDLSPAEKSLVTVTTLHRMARSLVERNRGTTALPMAAHIKMIGPGWRDVVWGDVLSLHPEREDSPRLSVMERQFDELNPPEDSFWLGLRETYFRLCRFLQRSGFR
jgi:hypothetical protein